MQVRTRAIRTAAIRRCGQRHTAEPRTWPSGTYTDEEVRILLADPDLVTEIIGGGDGGGAGSQDELAAKTVAELKALAVELTIDLEQLQGTGKGGGVVKDDIVRAIRERQVAGGSTEPTTPEGPRLVVEGEDNQETPGAQTPESGAEGGE